MSKLNFTQLFRILQQIRASCVQNPQSKTFCNPRTAWLDVLTTEILPSVRRNHQPATRICPACLVKWDLSRNTGFAYWPEWIPIPRGNKVFCSMGRGFIVIYHDLSNLYQIINISEPISASENIEICMPNMALKLVGYHQAMAILRRDRRIFTSSYVPWSSFVNDIFDG